MLAHAGYKELPNGAPDISGDYDMSQGRGIVTSGNLVVSYHPSHRSWIDSTGGRDAPPVVSFSVPSRGDHWLRPAGELERRTSGLYQG